MLDWEKLGKHSMNYIDLIVSTTIALVYYIVSRYLEIGVMEKDQNTCRKMAEISLNN